MKPLAVTKSLQRALFTASLASVRSPLAFAVDSIAASMVGFCRLYSFKFVIRQAGSSPPASVASTSGGGRIGIQRIGWNCGAKSAAPSLAAVVACVF
jgi:hypothetical protein